MSFATLDSPLRWLFLAHAIAGLVALLTVGIPLATKKGGRLHVRAGWVYTAAMLVVALSAFLITPWRIAFDPARSSTSIGFSAFLFFISAFTVCALLFAFLPLRAKARQTPSRAPLHLAPPLLLITLAAATQLVGFFLSSPLLMIFPLIAHLNAFGQLRYWLRAPTTRLHWRYAHMDGMFTATIATITAFVVTVIPRFVEHPWAQSPVLWIAPGAILGTIFNRWAASDRKRLESRS